MSGDFTIEALTGGLDRLTDMLLETFASHRAAVSLQMLTRRNYLKKRGDTNAYMVTPAFYESVKDLPPDDQERKRKGPFQTFSDRSCTPEDRRPTKPSSGTFSRRRSTSLSSPMSLWRSWRNSCWNVRKKQRISRRSRSAK